MSTDKLPSADSIGSSVSGAPGERTRRIVRTFMTQEMGDADILGLATGREQELARIIDAIERSRRAAPGTLQHVALYGNRGFGKSFITRLVQIQVVKRWPETPFLLLPEEQHSLQRDPHALLDTIALKLADSRSGGDTAYAEGHFRWPTAEASAKRWDDAEVGVERALDAALPAGGLAVVVVENFDVLLQRLFRDDLDEQRLRRWLDRKGNRLMLFATATGTVDMDYDRPLFQAFESVRLEPWSSEDCIAYFDRLRAHQGLAPLGPEREAKARAVAEFIGGTPRLAQLLGDVLETEDALEVAEIMAALTDRLADYYRRRIEDLAPLAIGLLDALIRGGEPCSQTELAARVGAGGQSDIARVMSELQRADIVRGTPAPDSREKLYRVPDRVFVHYYRLRQGSRAAHETPLSTILDFLRSFYSRDERRKQSLVHIEAGRLAEAGVFSRLARDGKAPSKDSYTQYFADNLRIYLGGQVGVPPIDAEAIVHALESDCPEDAFGHCLGGEQSDTAEAIRSVVRAQALYRLDHSGKAKETLETALERAQHDPVAHFIVLDQLIMFRTSQRQPITKNLREELQQFEGRLPRAMESRRAVRAAWIQANLGEYASAVDTATYAAVLASEVGDRLGEALSLRYLASSLSHLGNHEKAAEIARSAAAFAAKAGDRYGEAVCLRYQAFSLGQIGRHETAVEIATRAAKHAAELGDGPGEAISLRHQAYSLRELGRLEEAVEIAGRAAARAAESGDAREEAQSLRHQSYSLMQLGRYAQVTEVALRAATLAGEVGDAREQAVSLLNMTFSLIELGRYADALVEARKCVDLARTISDSDFLTLARILLLGAASHHPQPDVIGLIDEWIRSMKESDQSSSLSPSIWFASVFNAAAMADTWRDLDDLLVKHGEWLRANDEPILFARFHGQGYARVGEQYGRAAGYAAMAEALPRISTFVRSLPRGSQDVTWLPDIIAGYAEVCRDPGLLRDVAGVLTPEIAPQADETARLLHRLAEVDEAARPEVSLARMDPDIATLIRRLRNLPEPTRVPPQTNDRGRKRRKH